MAELRNNWIWGALMLVWGVLAVLLDALAIVLAAPFLGGKRSFFTIGPFLARHLFWVGGVRLEVQGWEKLPEDIRRAERPVIFMANHESNLDPPALISGIPIPAVYISKKELLWVPLVGWAAGLGGTIFIDRKNRERAAQSIHQAATKIRGGKSVVIFPEGTRTRNGALGTFKKGGFSLALDAGVPIVPLAIVGAFKVLPPGSLRMRPGCYAIRFGEAVDPAAFPSREALMAEVRGRIETLIQGGHP